MATHWAKEGARARVQGAQPGSSQKNRARFGVLPVRDADLGPGSIWIVFDRRSETKSPLIVNVKSAMSSPTTPTA